MQVTFPLLLPLFNSAFTLLFRIGPSLEKCVLGSSCLANVVHLWPPPPPPPQWTYLNSRVYLLGALQYVRGLGRPRLRTSN